MTNPNFRVVVSSDPDYEDLVGEVYYHDVIVCLLTQEDGFNMMQLELFTPTTGDKWIFNMNEFEDALKAVKARLWELRRYDP